MHKEKYEIDGVTLYRGDCFEVLGEIPAGSLDMVLTDPPYGTTDCAWDVCPPWDKLFRELWRVLKKNGVICMFSQNPLAAEIIMQERRHFRHEWVWEKSQAAGFLIAKKAPMRAHELILVFGRGSIMYNAIPIESQKLKPYYCKDREYVRTIYGLVGKACEKKSEDGSRCPRDVVYVDSISTSYRLHPTQKPLPLLEMLIGQYTRPGEMVLDCFAGSGSTLRAAQLTGRRAIGVEMREEYYAKARAWLASGNELGRRAEDDNQMRLAL